MTRHRGSGNCPPVNAGCVSPPPVKDATCVRLPIFQIRPALLLLAGLAACSTHGVFLYPPQVRGNLVDSEALQEIVAGTSTRADVTSLLGTPTTKATFDDSTWVYIGAMTRPQIAGTQNVLSQQVVTITFDGRGTVTAVNTRTDADSVPVDVVDRATPSPGTDASFIQQLLGNIGKFGPGGPPIGTNAPGNY